MQNPNGSSLPAEYLRLLLLLLARLGERTIAIGRKAVASGGVTWGTYARPGGVFSAEIPSLVGAWMAEHGHIARFSKLPSDLQAEEGVTLYGIGVPGKSYLLSAEAEKVAPTQVAPAPTQVAPEVAPAGETKEERAARKMRRAAGEETKEDKAIRKARKAEKTAERIASDVVGTIPAVAPSAPTSAPAKRTKEERDREMRLAHSGGWKELGRKLPEGDCGCIVSLSGSKGEEGFFVFRLAPDGGCKPGIDRARGIWAYRAQTHPELYPGSAPVCLLLVREGAEVGRRWANGGGECDPDGSALSAPTPAPAEVAPAPKKEGKKGKGAEVAPTPAPAGDSDLLARLAALLRELSPEKE